MIITISREVGSGGRIVGEQLAERLGIPFYDKVLIDMVAEESGFHPDFVQTNSKTLSRNQIYDISTRGYYMGPQLFGITRSFSDELYISQTKVIEKIAEEGSCVIVGRCADYILKDKEDCLKVFLSADVEVRKNRVIVDYNIDASEALSTIKKGDKERSRYYNFYTEQKWGDINNTNISLDTGYFSLDECVDILESIVNKSNK